MSRSPKTSICWLAVSPSRPNLLQDRLYNPARRARAETKLILLGILEQGVKTHDHRTLNLRAEEEIIDGQKHKVWKGIFSAVVCGSLACVAWDELKVMIVETQIRR